MREAKAEVVELDVREVGAGAGDGAGGDMSRAEVASVPVATPQRSAEQGGEGASAEHLGRSTERMHNGCLLTKILLVGVTSTTHPVAQILR